MRKFKVTASSNSSTLKVVPYVINKGQSGEYYGLKNAEDNQVLTSAPNNWKTKKGAIAWAKKKDYEVVESACGKKSVKASKKSVKAGASGRWADDLNSANNRNILDALEQSVASQYHNTTIDGVKILVHDVRATVAKGAYKFEVVFLPKDYDNDASLEVISDANSRGKFLCRVKDSNANIVDTFDIRMSGSKQAIFDKINEIANSLSSTVESACRKKSVKASKKFGIKASASAKRRKAVKGSKTNNHKYVKAYIDEYPDWVYDWSESKTGKNKKLYDAKLDEWYDMAESMFPNFYQLKGTDRKNAIADVNKAIGFTMDDVFSSVKVVASEDLDYVITFFGSPKSLNIVKTAANTSASFGTTILDGDQLDVVLNDDATLDDVEELIDVAQDHNAFLNVTSFRKLKKRFGVDASTHTSAKRIAASDYRDDDIIMYLNGDTVYTGSIYDLAEAVENLCYDEEVNAKFQEWCNQFGDPFDFDGSPIDTARIFTDIIIHEADEGPVTDDGGTQFYVDGDGILDFEIFYANDGVYSATGIKCSDSDGHADEWEDIREVSTQVFEYNGFTDSDMLEYVDAYLNDVEAWLNTDYVKYVSPDDWVVDASLGDEAVASDFLYFVEDWIEDRDFGINLDDINPNGIQGNDFFISFYPNNKQFPAPQIDLDGYYLTEQELQVLEKAVSIYEKRRIGMYKAMQEGLGDYLSKMYIDINSSVECAISNESKTNYKSNPIYELDKYVEDLAEGVVKELIDLQYELSDEAISFSDSKGEVIYVQPISEITPEPDDLKYDIEELVSAIQSDAFYKYDWESEEDDPDYAARKVQSNEYVDIDELEPITGEDDYGYGYDSNGDPIDESTVEELYRIAEYEILPKSKLAEYDEFVSIDEDSWEFYMSSPYVGESFDIHFDLTQDNDWFLNNNYVDFGGENDFKGWNASGESTLETVIKVKDGHVQAVEIPTSGRSSKYNADFDYEAIKRFITELAAPVAMDIYNTTTNL